MFNVYRSEIQINLKSFLLASQDFDDKDFIRKINILKRAILINDTKNVFIKKTIIIKINQNQVKFEFTTAYHEFMTLDQKGFVVIVNDNIKICALVIIRK